jgi:hypothetical protein
MFYLAYRVYVLYYANLCTPPLPERERERARALMCPSLSLQIGEERREQQQVADHGGSLVAR